MGKRKGKMVKKDKTCLETTLLKLRMCCCYFFVLLLFCWWHTWRLVSSSLNTMCSTYRYIIAVLSNECLRHLHLAAEGWPYRSSRDLFVIVSSMFHLCCGSVYFFVSTFALLSFFFYISIVVTSTVFVAFSSYTLPVLLFTWK